MSEVASQTHPAAGPWARLGLRWKIVGLIGASMLLLAGLLVALFAQQARAIVVGELRDRAHAMVQGLAKNLAYATSSGDVIALQLAADGTVRDTPDVAYVFFREASGPVMAHARQAALRERDPESLPKPASDGARERTLDLSGMTVLDVTEPIMGAEGAKVIGTAQVGMRVDRLTSQIGAVVVRAALLAAAVLAGCMIAGYLLARLLSVPLERLTAAAAGVAGGDLRQEVRAAGADEIAGLGRSFQTMAESLRGMLRDLTGVAARVDGEGRDILGSAAKQSAMASQQAAAINETSTTVAQIAQTAKLATDQADRVIAVAQRSEELSVNGRKVVEDAVTSIMSLGEQVRAIAKAMNDLNRRTQLIGDIVATVKELAEQSNLLALNAAIEASRAGEHGRGFSVVAAEMGKLAEQSRAAAGQVRSMLADVEKGTREASGATEEGSKRAQAAIDLAQGAGRNIEGLAEVIRESSQAARQIAINTRQQTAGVEQIVAAVEQLSTAMADSVEGTRVIERGASNLNTLSQQLLETVKRYRV
ncbi:MAG TPA: methyl-accepting chemotaxis protein [Anaeromyxobacter sp.]